MSDFSNTVATSICKALDNRQLNLILLPTEQCNFRCFYCYENFEIGIMKEPIITGVKNLIGNRIEDLDSLVISWFGGEPLLAQKVVQEISSHILYLIEKFPHVDYTGNMTTNGYLLDREAFKQLTELGICRYQISLDGDQEVHDKTRVTRRKEGTFEKIWSNLIEISKTDVKADILLRVHYSPDTWKRLDSLVEKINRFFGSDDRFQVFFRGINRLGGKNDPHISIVTESEKVSINKKLYDSLSNKSQAFDIYRSGSEQICYASKANSFVIRSTGQVGKCTVALYDEKNTVGFLNEDGTLSINQERFRPWIQGLITQEQDTLSCPASKIL